VHQSWIEAPPAGSGLIVVMRSAQVNPLPLVVNEAKAVTLESFHAQQIGGLNLNRQIGGTEQKRTVLFLERLVNMGFVLLEPGVDPWILPDKFKSMTGGQGWALFLFPGNGQLGEQSAGYDAGRFH